MGVKGTSVNEAALTTSYMQFTRSARKLEDETCPKISNSLKQIMDSDLLAADEQAKDQSAEVAKQLTTTITTSTESLKGTCTLFNDLISKATEINKSAAARANTSAENLKAVAGKLKKR